MRVNKKRERSLNPATFGLDTATWKMEKYSIDKDENLFNNRQYVKKAHKAYLRGKTYFEYDSNVYVVPRVRKESNIINTEVEDEN